MSDEKRIIGCVESDCTLKDMNHNLSVIATVFTVKCPADIFIKESESDFACLNIENSLGIINLLL